MFTAKDIADWHLHKVDRVAGDSITLPKLQKLTYYSQAWHLALYQESLFEENFEARPYGPTLPSLQAIFARYSSSCLSLPAPVHNINSRILRDKRLVQLLIDIIESYGKLQATQLENITCGEKPWILARGELCHRDPATPLISKESLECYYLEKFEKAMDRDMLCV
ncbi:MAG: DUF4065 domain-containing protein [Gammaproteobacteria bacterium]|nr:DUF4065 domain-containing protein [Pseudomonadota bacterium]MCH9662837.1 DUF4065 domain-containing protein [Gammaproteobacteria bacterium]